MTQVLKLAAAGVALAFLAGCGQPARYYQAGVPVQQLNGDLTGCAVQAVNTVPPNTQLRRTPIQIEPGVVRCNKDGNCVRFAGRVTGGDVYSVDANAGLRHRVAGQCMAERGYSRVDVPACPSGLGRVTAPGRLPPLTDSVCVLRDPDGRQVFLDRSTL
ncbi:hypothetical protein EKE94_04005 [Mesobaculum littorinae]|uniref:Lipoprotein n=1 Tax=Mesobaculum littorinae TaxID=2486419 RepID=A0A438AMD3_9RHOB|nr:hypothetical protein [Mesobaculum littorinae]RVV99842.1 hypothetical protein EKE94_04005 [Mesobaculum littorinae]